MVSFLIQFNFIKEILIRYWKDNDNEKTVKIKRIKLWQIYLHGTLAEGWVWLIQMGISRWKGGMRLLNWTQTTEGVMR